MDCLSTHCFCLAFVMHPVHSNIWLMQLCRGMLMILYLFTSMTYSFIALLLILTVTLIVSYEIFTFLSHNNYRFSNLLLLFVRIKYFTVCAIQLNNIHIINVTLLNLSVHYPTGSRWFCQIRIQSALQKKLLYERSRTKSQNWDFYPK